MNIHEEMMKQKLGQGSIVKVKQSAIEDHHVDHYKGATGKIIDELGLEGGDYVNVFWNRSWTSTWRRDELEEAKEAA